MSEKPVPLRFKLPAASEVEFYARFAEGVTRGGMFIATASPRPVGTLVAFEFALSNGRPLIRGEGRVESIVEKGEGLRAGMTLRFTGLDGDSLERIARAMAAAQGQRGAVLPGVGTAATPLFDNAGAVPPREAARGPVIGIDLGTSFCRAAAFLDGRAVLLPLEGLETALPSVVAFDDAGLPIVGNRALERTLVDPRRAVFGLKRLIGRRAGSDAVRQVGELGAFEIVAGERGEAAVRLGDRLSSPAAIAGLLLAEVRDRACEALGRPVERAVLCVPASFGDRQRRAVLEAGRLAGFSVERLITESTAVAIAHGQGRALARKRLFVFDMGGGHLEAAVVEVTGDEFELLAAGGDAGLGGLDFDRRLAGFLAGHLAATHGCPPPEAPLARQRLRAAAEAAKIALSGQEEARVFLDRLATHEARDLDLDVMVGRTRFQELTDDLVARAVRLATEVLGEAHLTPGAVDEVILAGGQGGSPRLRAAVAELFGRSPLPFSEPGGAVALGAALVGEALRADDPAVFALEVGEVLTSSLGIGLGDGGLWRVLGRGLRLPCEKTVGVPSGREGEVRVAVFQGEGETWDRAEWLGVLSAQGPASGAEVSFSVSRDGLLTLAVTDRGGVLVRAELDEDPDLLPTALLPAQPPAPPDPGLLGFLRRLFSRR